MDVLSLSQETASQLSALESLTAEQIGKMFRIFMQTLLVGEGKEIDEAWRSVLNALGTLLIEAARTNSTEAQLRSVLAEQGLPGSVVEIVVALFLQYRDLLTTHLSKIGISLPRLVGVEWRLDYAIRSKHLGKDNAPLFFVALKVREGAAMKDVVFLATLEEMQDLLSKVRDAVKQVERVLNYTES